MLDWAIEAGMPVHVLLTKADKLKRGPAQSTMLQVKKAVKHLGDQVTVQTFSSLTGDGIDVLKKRLDLWLTAPEETDDQPAGNPEA